MNTNGLLAKWLGSARSEIAQNLLAWGIRLEDYTVCYQLFLSGQSHQLLPEDQLLEQLVREGEFPAVADIAPTAILDTRLILAVMPSGRAWVATAEQTWGGPEKGPFKACPWSLPDSILKGSPPTVESFLKHGRLLRSDLSM